MRTVRTVSTLLALVLFCAGAQAQRSAPEGYMYVDSLVFTPLAGVDSTLVGKNVFSVLPQGVDVVQSGPIRNSVSSMSGAGSEKTVNGYRIRIFFDNSRTARTESEAALYRFQVANPGVGAYRTFSSPYFKVTVGDYRNKSEALAALQEIRKDFPSAFIVRERFRFPAMENTSAYRVDTLRVLRPIKQ